MTGCIIKLWKRNKELILYGIFGVGATLVNIVTFYIFSHFLGLTFLTANIGAWILAFIFAFITNKFLVFDSKSLSRKSSFIEMFEFFIIRFLTGVLDTFLMWVFIEVCFINDIISKIIVNILVIIINFIASKFWIFKKEM